MSTTYTVFWSVEVEVEEGVSVAECARRAFEICRGTEVGDAGAANVFHVAVLGGEAARLLRRAAGRAARVDLGATSIEVEPC